MNRQNRSLRYAMMTALLALSCVSTYAQSVQKVGGTKAGRPSEETIAARVDGQPMVKDYQKLLDWLNANPMQMTVGGGGDSTGCKPKFVYRNLAVDTTGRAAFFKSGCGFELVVPVKTPDPVLLAGRDFEGTVYIPKEFQEGSARERRRLEPKIDPATGGVAKGMPNPYLEALRNIQIALFDLATGRMEAQTTTDGNGSVKFAGISDGQKAIFIKDAGGNLYFVGNVETCSRVIGKDGKGCTEGPYGPRVRTAQFTLAPEIGSMFRRNRPLTRT